MPMQWRPGRTRAEILREIADVLTSRNIERRRLASLLHEYAYEVDKPDQPEVLTLAEMQARVAADAVRRCGSVLAAARQLKCTAYKIYRWLERWNVDVSQRGAGRPGMFEPLQIDPTLEVVVPYRKRERECIVIALAAAHGRVLQAADLLGISAGKLRRLMANHIGLEGESRKTLRRPADGDWHPFPKRVEPKEDQG